MRSGRLVRLTKLKTKMRWSRLLMKCRMMSGRLLVRGWAMTTKLDVDIRMFAWERKGKIYSMCVLTEDFEGIEHVTALRR